MILQRNVSLKSFNTFGIDVNAGLLATIREEEDLRTLYNRAQYKPHRKLILGGGSNVLFTRGFTGVVARNCIQGITIIQETTHTVIVEVGAGEAWHPFVLWSIEHDLAGLENLSLIPGTVGAAPMQNIGAYGVELKEVFHSLQAFEIKTGKIVTFTNSDCQFDYRYSIFKGELKDQFVITKVLFALRREPIFNLSYGNLRETLDKMNVEQPTLKSVSQAVINIRSSKLPDPDEIGNAGSFFKNPVIEKAHFEALEAQFGDVVSYPVDDTSVKIPAGWLIEHAGWRGYRTGDIGVHDKQALVLVNHGNGRGTDLLKLSEKIIDSVQKKYGIVLEREVNIIR
ncbi:MAG: UDP-N-acetylmuramate dehydrogenase [Bacteroidota bacterium]